MTDPVLLPIELILLIAELLPLGDTVNWSSDSSALRIALTPLIFESISFNSHEGKADGVLKFVQRHSNLVRNLTYTCMVNLNADMQI